MDVKNDSSKRVLGVAVVEASRPRDGVIANELIVWVPESDMHTETQINTSNTHQGNKMNTGRYKNTLSRTHQSDINTLIDYTHTHTH